MVVKEYAQGSENTVYFISTNATTQKQKAKFVNKLPLGKMRVAT